MINRGFWERLISKTVSVRFVVVVVAVVVLSFTSCYVSCIQYDVVTHWHFPFWGAYDVVDDSGVARYEFAFVTSLSSQSGIHKPDQVYVAARVVEETVSEPTELFEGLILELSTLEFSPNQCDYLPQQPAQVGPLRQYSSDLYAARLLDLPGLYREGLKPVSVSLHSLRYEDISPSRVKVLGVHDDFSMVCSSASIEAFDLSANQADPEPDQLQHDGDQPLDVDGGPHCDFLAMLEDKKPANSARKRRRTTKQFPSDNPEETAKEDNVSSEGPETGSILDDPCIRTFLGGEDVLALFQAFDLCRAAEEASSFHAYRERAFQCEPDSESEGHSAKYAGSGITQQNVGLVIYYERHCIQSSHLCYENTHVFA